MRALTLASAKHLMNQGHITPEHHARIVAAVSPTKPIRRQKAPQGIRGFGSLAQQAQAPIPGISGPAATPDGTSSGY
jgi:hypothetical protein